MRVVAAGLARLFRREDAVGAHDTAGVELAHHQMLAEGIEAIVLDSVLGIGEDRAHVFGEDVVAQALDLFNFLGRARQADHQHPCGGARPRFCSITAWIDAC